MHGFRWNVLLMILPLLIGQPVFCESTMVSSLCMPVAVSKNGIIWSLWEIINRHDYKETFRSFWLKSFWLEDLRSSVYIWRELFRFCGLHAPLREWNQLCHSHVTSRFHCKHHTFICLFSIVVMIVLSLLSKWHFDQKKPKQICWNMFSHGRGT